LWKEEMMEIHIPEIGENDCAQPKGITKSGKAMKEK
jgi:hypothetical protein